MLKEVLKKLKSYKIVKEIGEDKRVEEIEDSLLNPYHLRVICETESEKKTIIDDDVENMKLVPFMRFNSYFHCYGDGILFSIIGKEGAEKRTFWKEVGKPSREIIQLKGMMKRSSKGHLAIFNNTQNIILLDLDGFEMTEIVDCDDAIIFSESIIELMKDDFYQYVEWSRQDKKETEYLMWPFKERYGYQVNKTIDNHWKLYQITPNEIKELEGFLFSNMTKVKYVPDDNLFLGYYGEKTYLVSASETQARVFEIPGDKIEYTAVQASRVLSFGKDEIYIEKEKTIKVYKIQDRNGRMWLGKFDQDGNFRIL